MKRGQTGVNDAPSAIRGKLKRSEKKESGKSKAPIETLKQLPTPTRSIDTSSVNLLKGLGNASVKTSKRVIPTGLPVTGPSTLTSSTGIRTSPTKGLDKSAESGKQQKGIRFCPWTIEWI